MQHQIHNLFPTYETIIYYQPTTLYQPPQPLQHPFFFLNFNYFLGQQMGANNGELYNNPYTPNCLQRKVQSASQAPSNQSQTVIHSATQNVQDQQIIPDVIQKKKPCVREDNDVLSPKQQIDINYKRGNDRFIKKNTESNVINQVFSFLWTPEKSQLFLAKILRESIKIEAFYKLMKLIKTNCKSQLNRHYLKSLVDRDEFQSGFSKLKKKVKKIECISLQQICTSIKKLVYIYLREISRYSIMTSKKMNQKLWKLHFSKCNEIQTFLFVSSHL